MEQTKPLDALLAYLDEEIRFEEGAGNSLDTRSWVDSIGILISVEEAKMILEKLGPMKVYVNGNQTTWEDLGPIRL